MLKVRRYQIIFVSLQYKDKCMEQMEQLLKSVELFGKQIDVARKESSLRGEQFNIFKVCGIDHYELMHSAILSELLDPQGSHGQKAQYLKLFMKQYHSNLFEKKIDFDRVVVRREEWTVDHSGRMDIYIEYEGYPIVIIENKIYASDQNIQLKRYDQDAKIRKAPFYEIVYLTLNGKEASPDSGEDVDYIKASYSSTIIEWLDSCIKQSVRFPLIRETLIQYQNHIKQLTNQNMSQENNITLFEMMTKYPEAAKILLDVNKDEYIHYLFETNVKNKLETFANENGLSYKEERLWSGQTNKGFYFHKESWKNYAIWFFTERQGLYDFYYGISNFREPTLPPQQKLECLDFAPSEGWPYGSSWFKYRTWNGQVVPDMINGAFADEIINVVKIILLEIKNKQTEVW